VTSDVAADKEVCRSWNNGVCAELEDELDDVGHLHLIQKRASIQQGASAASNASGTVLSMAQQVLQVPLEVAPIEHRLSEADDCSMKEADAGMVRVAVICPCAMILFFAILAVVGHMLWERPEPKHQGHSPREETLQAMEADRPHTNWHFVYWAGTAVAMANVNYLVVLPAAAENFSGSNLEAGVWVGLYALGALLALPYFVSLGHKSSRAALSAHALFTMLGNIVMVIASFKGSLGWLYFGRVVTGCAYAYQFSCDSGCLHLIPSWDRLEALFITLMARAIGFAFGPCIGPISSQLILRFPYIRDSFPNYNTASQALPLFILVVYGVVFLFATVCFLPDFQILDAVSEGVSETSSEASYDVASVTWGAKVQTMKVFTAVNISNFTRIFIRVAWEAGAIMVLAHEYCLATWAGFVLGLTAITLVICRAALSRVSIAVGGDTAALMRILELTGLLSCPLLFRLGLATESSLCFFLVGSCIFYNANNAQSGVLLAIASEVAIPGEKWLDKRALTIYYFLTHILGYFFGPIISFISSGRSLGQNAVAALLATVTILQIAITCSTVRPKHEGKATPRNAEVAVEHLKLACSQVHEPSNQIYETGQNGA
jgi:MFS family permease